MVGYRCNLTAEQNEEVRGAAFSGSFGRTADAGNSKRVFVNSAQVLEIAVVVSLQWLPKYARFVAIWWHKPVIVDLHIGPPSGLGGVLKGLLWTRFVARVPLENERRREQSGYKTCEDIRLACLDLGQGLLHLSNDGCSCFWDAKLG